MNASEYKKYHEKFMHNNNGSTPVHTLFCILLTVLCSILSSLSNRTANYNVYIQEYLIIVIPLLFAHTLLAEYIYQLNLICALTLLLILAHKREYVGVKSAFNKTNYVKTNRLTSISFMRGLTYLITVFCILAVDFKVFPRYLAKTEHFGYSLMDTGVGLFVLMSGLVHKDYPKNTLVFFIKDNLKLSTILFALGLVRFILIKQLDYHEHVSEYGVHWNFFFTLAISKVASSVILYLCGNYVSSIILSILVLISHESFLAMGLEEWVFSDTTRNTFLSANREGISSCLGYVGMYLLAVHYKRVICNKGVLRKEVLMHLFIGSIVTWLFVAATCVYKPASRTLANFGYSCYVTGIFLIVILLLYFLEIVLQNGSTNSFNLPIILSVINSNGLLYFLTANLLTGLVNLTIRTLLINYCLAILILNIYMIITLAIAVLLKVKGVRL